MNFPVHLKEFQRENGWKIPGQMAVLTDPEKMK
jgi:transposase-like protein